MGNAQNINLMTSQQEAEETEVLKQALNHLESEAVVINPQAAALTSPTTGSITDHVAPPNATLLLTPTTSITDVVAPPLLVPNNVVHETKSKLCVICLDREKEYVCLPCGHLCLCGGRCRDYVIDKSRKCPVCRVEVRCKPKRIYNGE